MLFLCFFMLQANNVATMYVWYWSQISVKIKNYQKLQSYKDEA